MTLIAANAVAAVVTSGGTDAPSSGTVETLTVTTLEDWPILSGGQILPAMDQADVGKTSSYEIFYLSATANGPDVSFTAERGAEGTAPHSHAAGFTLVPVITEALLAGIGESYLPLAGGGMEGDIVSGAQSLYVTSNYCVALGSAITQSGTDNTAIGYGAGGGGNNNIGIGNAATQGNTGDQNTAVGYGALSNSNSGLGNTAIGSGALAYNSTGHENTGVGWNALEHNTTGTYNVAVGSGAMGGTSSITGSRNTVVGYGAGTSITSETDNTLIGYRAGGFLVGGTGNTAVGGGAFAGTAGGNNNCAFGQEALGSTSSGSSNTAIGFQALENLTTGSDNTALGLGAGSTVTTLNGTVSIGTDNLGNAAQPAADNDFVLGTGLHNVKVPGVFFPQQAATGSAPPYVKGGMYFDTTLNKLRIGGASGWETVTSS